MTEQYLLIIGNPADGFRYIGPFPDADAATEHADREAKCIGAGDWWLVKLENPEEKSDD